MKYLVIFKVGETFSSLADQIGDFEQWILDGLGPITLEIRVVDPRAGEALPVHEDVGGAIITGSHAMVTDKSQWSEALAAWLRDAVAVKVPVLGICYGHQLLAYALGGEVDYHPVGLEIGTVPITLNENAHQDLLFSQMPSNFLAQVVHRQSVRKLPEAAILLGSNEFERHHVFRIGECAWGVQFHPEFSDEAIASYVTHMSKAGRVAGKPAQTVLEQVAPTEQASALLKNFATLVSRCSVDQKSCSKAVP